MDKKDLFYDLLANPQLTPADLEAVGHSSEVSILLDKDVYKNNKKVRAEFTKNDGSFDEKAFDNAYMLASAYYKGLTDDTLNTNLIKYTSFDLDNIFVAPKLRTDKSNIPSIAIGPNPLRQTQSLFEVGKYADSDRSIDEIAQAEKILLNPVAVDQGADPEWGESPNDEWLTNPFSTRVLAKWDSEGYHSDPLTGDTVHHEKDELKINSHGTYYYEDLDGRSIYGRLVLNKLNTLTTDGSWANKYLDFFDSDDLEQKSVGGSVMKNLALVGTMFIPYVGWGVAAASVIHQSVGLIGTLGKMLVGSDSPTLSAMEGFSQSWNRQTAKTQYAQENTLCWENFIDLIGDTTALLREQRAIFKFVPAILKGKYGAMGNEGVELLKKEKTDALMKDFYANTSQAELVKQMSKSGKPLDYIVKTLNSGIDKNMMSRIADKQVLDYFTKYNEIGEKIARAYMVGITVGDSYGEAKNAGASDAEAALLTMGYAAAENQLLSTELGRWIFPELKGNRIKYKSIAKAVMGLPEETKQMANSLTAASTTEKKNWVKKLFNLGKEAAKKDYTLLNKTAGAVLASGLGEGVEEVSEELLADFSKACFNLYRDMTGLEAILDTFGHNWDWEDAARRYGMSFFGGIIGGGINGAATDFTTLLDYKNIKSNQAMQQLVWMARNGELEDFYKTVDKMELGNSKIGTTKNEDGTWKIGTKEDNQDLEAKKLLKSTIQHIQDLVNAEGARLDDTSFIGLVLKANPNIDSTEVIKDFRTEAVANSSAAGKLLTLYNTLIKDIVDLLMLINNLMNSFNSDSKLSKEVKEFKEGNSSNSTLEKVEKLKKLLDEKRKIKDDIMAGKYTPLLYRHALFESTYALAEGFTTATEELYVKKHTNKKWSDLTLEEKEELHKKYIDYCKSEKAEDMEFFADIYYDLAKATSTGLKESMDFYKLLRDGNLNRVKALQNMSAAMFRDVEFLLQNNSDITDILNYLLSISKNVEGNYSLIADIVPAYQALYSNNIKEKDISKVQLLRELYNNEQDATKKEAIQNQIDAIDPSNHILNYLDIIEYGTSAVQNATGGLSKFIERVKEIYKDPSLTNFTRGDHLKSALFDSVLGELINSVKDLKKVGFVHPEVRDALKNALEDFLKTINRFSLIERGDIAIKAQSPINPTPYSQYNDDDFYIVGVLDKLDLVNSALNTLENLPNTPLQKILDTFTTSLKTNKKVSQILSEAIHKLNEHLSALENIAIADEAELYDYKQALAVLKMIRQAIIGARVDNVDLDNLYGYNKTLNELTASEKGTVKLAEINLVDADYALLDINLAIARLEMIQGLHELNSGNKLNLQNHVAVNKSLIIYNKVRRFITSIRDDDNGIDPKDLLEIEEILDNKMPVHKEAWGKPEDDPLHNVSARTLGLNPEKRKLLEKEDTLLEEAIYNFFLSHKSLVEDSIKLSKLFQSLDFFKLNDGTLSKGSLDIDDNSFVWWLASKAALRASEYLAVATTAMDDASTKNLVAPIPTLELGILIGIAAIYNGNIFKHFGNAILQNIKDKWKNYSEEERLKIIKTNKLITYDSKGTLYGFLDPKYKEEESNPTLRDNLPSYDALNSNDLAPQFTNILFIEGIAGSGKSTGVFKSILKILFNLNTEIAAGKTLSEYPIFYAHTSKEHADNAVSSFNVPSGWNFKTFGKKLLLSYFTNDYSEDIDPSTGEYRYYLKNDSDPSKINVEYDDDTKRYRLTWRIKDFSNPDKDVPKVIFIDEFTHYTLLECDFLLRVSEKYGIQIITGGDADQITPIAVVYKNGKPAFDATFSRNTFIRAPKLGVSMRTGNGQKTENQNKVRNWQYHKNLLIELTHIEINDLLYGDKVYNAGKELSTTQLNKIRSDIKKMVTSLNKDEKIGYIYSAEFSKNPSALYTMIENEFKDHFTFYKDTEAQGMEGRYYIIENDRSLDIEVTEGGKKRSIARPASLYWKSLYTGITRASQASIIIAPEKPLGEKQSGTILVVNAKVQPDRLIPDNYTAQGLTLYTKTRKENSTSSWKSFMHEKYPSNKTPMEQVKLSYLARSHSHSVTSSSSTTTTPPVPTPTPPTSSPTSATVAPVPAVPLAAPTPASTAVSAPATPTTPTPAPASATKPASATVVGKATPTPKVTKTPVSKSSSAVTPPTPVTSPAAVPAATPKSNSKSSSTTTPPVPKPTVPSYYKYGTEILKQDPATGNYEPIGAVLNYNEDSESYTLTQDGINPSGQISVGDLNDTKSSFQILDPELALSQGTFKLLSKYGPNGYDGKYKPGTFIIDITTGMPVGTIIGYDYNTGDYTIDLEERGQLRASKTTIENPLNYAISTRPVAYYKENQVLEKNGTKVTIKEIRWVNFKPLYIVDIETKDTLNTDSFEEDALTEFINNVEPIIDEDTVETPEEDSLPFDARLDIEGENNSTLVLETKVSNVEPSNNVPIVSFNFLGHTFNTFYTGLHYENGIVLPITDPRQKDRIDCGNGLLKINPALCNDETNVIRILGEIRAAAMYYLDNESIISYIKELLGKEDDNLEIRYAFISKAEGSNLNYAEHHSRFAPPTDYELRNCNDLLENDEERKVVPAKTISLIVRRTANANDSNDIGESILEVPLITLTSPHNILSLLIHTVENSLKSGANPDTYAHLLELTSMYKQLVGLYKEEGHYRIFSELYNFLGGSKYKDSDDYKILRNICKVWLFTNNGIKFLGTDSNFNFCAAFKNLGVTYVSERSAEETIDTAYDSKYPFRFKGTWKSLEQEVIDRPEVAYSGVMITKSDKINYEGKDYIIARPGHPFVLRYDGTTQALLQGKLNASNEELLRLYLEQLADPTLPLAVTLIYITPPEVSILKYLEGMSERNKNPYGNAFTPYNILSCLYQQPNLYILNKYLPFAEKKKLREDTDAIMKALMDIESSYVPEDGESRATSLTKIRKLQNEYLAADASRLRTLNSALFYISYTHTKGRRSKFSSAIADSIATVCNSLGLTGVLWKKKTTSDEALYNVVLQLEHVHNNKFAIPDGTPWRIFSKFDSPTFDMSALFGHKDSLISWIADRIKPNSKAYNKSVYMISGTYRDNLLYEGVTPYNTTKHKGGNNQKAGNKKNALWRSLNKMTLQRIGLTEEELSTFGENCSTKKEFNLAIITRWLSHTNSVSNSHFGFIIGHTAIIGDIIPDGALGLDIKVLEYFKNKVFKSAVVDPLDQSVYNLYYQDANGNTFLIKIKFNSDFTKYSIIYNPSEVMFLEGEENINVEEREEESITSTEEEQGGSEGSTEEESPQGNPDENPTSEENGIPENDKLTPEDIERYKQICNKHIESPLLREVLEVLEDENNHFTSKEELAKKLMEREDFDILGDGPYIGYTLFNDEDYFDKYDEDENEDENGICPINSNDKYPF